MIVRNKLNKWDKRFLRLAREVSTWSKDPKTQVGAVITKDNKELAFGYNGFPQCIEDKPEWYKNRELKLSLVIHAEINARNKIENSSDMIGGTIYTWPCAPCGDCAKQIVSWGIERIVAPRGRREYEMATENVIKHCTQSHEGYIKNLIQEYYWCDPSEIAEG